MSDVSRPMRAVIYARYSSDSQSEQSIDDQIRVCRAQAERERWSVVDVYADYALSGASASRPRFQQLLHDARAGKFEVILAEALDRISRDQEHIAGFHKHVSFAGVRVVTLAEGAITELHVGLKGTMSALFLKDLAQKTHRGLEGRVRAGLSGGGLCYGYHVLRELAPDGTPVAGQMEIVAEEAAMLQRIFAAYAGGQSPRSIARQLNAEGVRGPRGGQWTASLLLGNAARETGLLRNRLYIGERVWNRQHFLKDPATGKRIARPNPPQEWISVPVPQLAIIAAPLWATVQARLEAMRRLVCPASSDSQPEVEIPVTIGARMASARRPRWLLAGIVRCGHCQGPMSVMGSGGRLGCANHVERGTCGNRRTVLRDKLVQRVLGGLKERLLAPELIAEFVRGYIEEINAANRGRSERQAGLRQAHAKLARQIRNLLELIKDGHGSAAMAAELRDLERRQDEIAQEVAATGTPEPLPTLHPNLPELYRRNVETLETALRDPELATPAAEALRGLIDAIEVFGGERRGEVSIQLRGDLAAFLHLGERSQGIDMPDSKTAVPAVGNGRFAFGHGVLGSLVAGTGFEPVTFRL